MTTIFYDWILPRKNEFVGRFGDNETKTKLAKEFWKSIEQNELYLFLICALAIAILACVIYYTWYNNRPGRHYRIRHWAGWMVGATVCACVVTYFSCQLLLDNVSKLQGTGNVVFYLIFANIIYTVLIYLGLSAIWCNYWSTNAYRFLKFKR